MGIINELKYTYDACGNMRKYELNEILAEKISKYISYTCNEGEIKAINDEFGCINACSRVLAENFTSNNGSFKEELLNENIFGKAGGKGLGMLGKLLSRKLTGKLTGKVASRFGRATLVDAAKFAGKKTVKELTHKDMGKFIVKDMVKNANPKVAKALEKDAAWLSKNTNMSAQQIESFVRKNSSCPAGCDPKLWKKAWKEEAKNFHNGVNINGNAVKARYNVLAKASGKAAYGSAPQTLTGKILQGAANLLGKGWKIIKIGGKLFLLGAAGWFILGKTGLWEKWFGGSSSDENSEGEQTNNNDVYSKEYGQAYLDANPDDYRL